MFTSNRWKPLLMFIVISFTGAIADNYLCEHYFQNTTHAFIDHPLVNFRYLVLMIASALFLGHALKVKRINLVLLFIALSGVLLGISTQLMFHFQEHIDPVFLCTLFLSVVTFIFISLRNMSRKNSDYYSDMRRKYAR